MSLKTIGVSRNIVEITEPATGFFRVVKNGKPISDWCNRQAAERAAYAWGWRPDGKEGAPKSLVNSFANEVAPGIILAIGRPQRLAFA